ncbi:hypothetical protein NL676_020164 [Syzygium grande]|nr:hypothetical protein NL676_020164 [Syzygium grande]
MRLGHPATTAFALAPPLPRISLITTTSRHKIKPCTSHDGLATNDPFGLAPVITPGLWLWRSKHNRLHVRCHSGSNFVEVGHDHLSFIELAAMVAPASRLSSN